MIRGLLYCVTPDQGRIGGHVLHMLDSLRARYHHIAVTINGQASREEAEPLYASADQVLLGQNADSIEAAYAAGLQHLGREIIISWDELTLMSCDLFGPVQPIAPFFAAMDADPEVDFWGLAEATDWAPPPPLPGTEASKTYIAPEMPTCLDPNFLTFRKRLLRSNDFWTLWSDSLPRKASMPLLRPELEKAVDQLAFLKDRGYKTSCYLQLRDFLTPEPLFLEMQTALKRNRLPFLRFSPFCRSAMYQDDFPTNLNQVIPLVARISNYPQELFWQTALRRASLRTLHTNLAYQFTFDSTNYPDNPNSIESLRVAVCAHVYYPDVLPEILDRATTIPISFDLYITTASEENREAIKLLCKNSGIPQNCKIDVRVVGQNRGRDMSSLYIDLQDVILNGGYDLICRMHSKRTPQVNASTGNYFKQYIFDAVLGSKAYTAHLLSFFSNNPKVGMAFAPMIHTGFGTLGAGWFNNRSIFGQIMDELGCSAPYEPYSPIAAYGTVYWFRPEALRPLFEGHYSYEDYNVEPNHLDGGLAHGQERVMAYVAQSRGYMTATVWPDYVAAQSTTLMEYKLDTIYTHFRQGRTAPHSVLMRALRERPDDVIVGLPILRLTTPNFLRRFEHRHRPLFKEIGRMLGIRK